MAKVFNFNLQKVLDIRVHKEEQKSIELGKAKSIFELEKMRLNNLNTKKDQVLKETSEAFTSTPDLNQILIGGSYIRQLNTSIEKQKTVIVEKNKIVDEKRNELLEAVKEKKIVENLKERKKEEYKKQLLRAENKRDDEVAGRMVNRGAREIN